MDKAYVFKDSQEIFEETKTVINIISEFTLLFFTNSLRLGLPMQNSNCDFHVCMKVCVKHHLNAASLRAWQSYLNSLSPYEPACGIHTTGTILSL